MKATYLLIGLALACVVGACSRDEESLFDKSASERAQEAMDNANAVLVAPANGWEMLYFANTESKGYNVVLKFEENGRVIATAKNTETTGNKLVTDSVSTWQVKLDYGPIITFDTYNEVIHAWADPQTDGDGYLGDYEFLILHADPNYIKLKGKKHSGYCYLFPMEEGKTVEAYFEEIEDMQAKLFGNGNVLRLHAEGQEYMLHKGSTGIFSLTAVGEKPNTEEEDIYPFATRQHGVQLMVPFLSTQDLQYEVKNGKLVSDNTSMNAIEPVPYVLEYMQMFSGSWVIDFTDTCDSIQNAVAAVNAQLKKSYRKYGKMQGLRIKKTSQNIVLVFSYYGTTDKSTVDMNYVFEVVSEGDALKIQYVAPADDNAQKTLNAFPTMADLFLALSGTFSTEATVALNPNYGIKLNNKSTSQVWYNISGKL